jgi:hypothetical protein
MPTIALSQSQYELLEAAATEDGMLRLDNLADYVTGEDLKWLKLVEPDHGRLRVSADGEAVLRAGRRVPKRPTMLITFAQPVLSRNYGR